MISQSAERREQSAVQNAEFRVDHRGVETGESRMRSAGFGVRRAAWMTVQKADTAQNAAWRVDRSREYQAQIAKGKSPCRGQSGESIIVGSVELRE